MKLKFLKIYSGPGYPVDPLKQEYRKQDYWINFVLQAENISDDLSTRKGINYDALKKLCYEKRN